MRVKAKKALLRSGRILCAVSGGADSMCMLHLLWSEGADIAVGHFEHGIRGDESRRDADFFENWCREAGIECVIGHGNVPEYAVEHSIGIEEAARILRYEFLSDTAEKMGCIYIATAHNADDNAETLLFNLSRGAGAAGLRGIPEQRENIIRPLLSFSREDIQAYNKENNVPHVEDSTNCSDDYNRNLIRHRVTPVLRSINPCFSDSCLRTCRLMRQDDECLEELASAFLRDSFDGKSADAVKLSALHPAVSSRVIRRMAKRSLAMEQVDSVLDICRSTEHKSVDVPGGCFAVDCGRLYADPDTAVLPFEFELSAGSSIYLPACGLTVKAEETVYSGEVNDLFKTLYLRCENIGSVILTSRAAGDKMRPSGRNCRKSLKSLFLEKRLGAAQRNSFPIIRDRDGILAVYGLAIDERAIPLPGDRVIHITFE